MTLNILVARYYTPHVRSAVDKNEEALHILAGKIVFRCPKCDSAYVEGSYVEDFAIEYYCNCGLVFTAVYSKGSTRYSVNGGFVK